MTPNPKYITSYRPERRSRLDRILNMNKLDLVFYMLLTIIGSSLAAVSLVWVICQTKAIWGL